jgi:hypothetical protein
VFYVMGVDRKDEQMQLIGALIFIAILVLLFGLALYFARGQSPKREHYGSWSNVLGPQYRGSVYDVREKLNEEIEAGRGQSRRVRRSHHSKDKER